MDQSTFRAQGDDGHGRLSRRALVQGAAWAVPAISIAAAAPAFAGSQPCSFSTLNWVSRVDEQNATTSLSGAKAVAAPNGGTLLNTGYSNMFPEKLTIAALPEFSGSNWLRLASGGPNSAGETVTVTFPTNVYCVTLYVQDIDTQFVSASSKYRDDVTVTGFTASVAAPSSTYTSVSSSQATSINTAASGSATTWSWDYTSSVNGLAKFTAAGPLNTISLVYKNTSTGGGSGVNDNDMQVWVSPIKYSTADCLC